MSYQQISPSTGADLGSVDRTDPGTFPSIFGAARSAQRTWAQKSFNERAKHLKRVKSFLADNADRAAEIIADNNGKTRQDALATEILPCIMACDWYGANTKSVLKPQKVPNGNILFANKTNTLHYSPVGVVGIISPWNYPFSIPFGEVLMGLMAGNAVILKVAEQTALVGKFLEECIAAGGFPAGLFTHVVMDGPTFGAAMFENNVDKLFFTGSVRVGKILMAQAAPTLTPLSLELGGKDPMIVCEDADIERAVNCALWSGFQNAGQSCAGLERVYVHEDVYDRFITQLCEKTRALRHGPDANFEVDIGAVTTKPQLELITKQVDAAVKQGAKIAAQSYAVGDVTSGQFYPATVLVNVTHDMTIMKEETFGPVLPVMTFSTIDEAISLANDCCMALTSSVFSKSSKTAKKIAERLESGVVTINDHLYSHGLSEAPWGGWKESGIGRTHGPLGLREMCNVKCINNELLPSSWIPRNMWWYPFSKESYAGMRSGVSFLSPSGCCNFLSASCTLVKFAVGKMFTVWKPKTSKDGKKNYNTM